MHDLVRELDPTSLMVLMAVADTGSFTAAARQLSISQPAASLALKRLEERVGTALLVRTRKRATPTRPGELLIAGARLAMDSLSDALAHIENQQLEPSGRVVLGCHESLAAYALPSFMARLTRDYPKIELQLWNGSSLEVETELVAGRVDLGLIVNPSRHPDTVLTPLFDDSVELFHCLRVGGEPHELLRTMPLVYVPALAQSRDLLRRLDERGIESPRLLPCSSLELVKSLVLDRVGVGILPRRVASYGTRRRLHSLSPPMPRYRDRIALVRRYDLPRTAAIREVVAQLEAHGKAMS